MYHGKELRANRYIFERGFSDQTRIFASLAMIILKRAEQCGSDDLEYVTRWLGEAHHNLSLIACMTRSSNGIQDCQVWLDILRMRLNTYHLSSDTVSLAVAYNQMGICYLNENAVEDAISNFQQSLLTFDSLHDAPDFSGTFPRISLSVLYTLQGEPDKADAVLIPALEEHERKLGMDDISTSE